MRDKMSDSTVPNNLEDLINLLNRTINIDSGRQVYANLFTHLRDSLFDRVNGLRKNNEFERLYNGFQLEGSYGDNLKVTAPDEFDLVFLLKLPYYEKIIWTASKAMPGFVNINIEPVLNELKKNKLEQPIRNLLMQWINDKNLLRVECIVAWLTSHFTKALNAMKNRITVDNVEYKLKLQQQGPAQTISMTRACDGVFMLSVDFVAAIKLQMQSKKCTFEAIPKPLHTGDPNYVFFRESHYNREREIMKNNYNLKNALRFMKKFRDKNQNMSNLKSYYIKTMFLWQAKDKDRNYWKQPLCNIIIDMFTRLEEFISKKELPFYWNPNCNMFANLTHKQLAEMLNCVTSHRSTLVAQRFHFTNYVSVNRIFYKL